nr:hypothetical protein [uncultured Mediterraneibacter sp.]
MQISNQEAKYIVVAVTDWLLFTPMSITPLIGMEDARIVCKQQRFVSC